MVKMSARTVLCVHVCLMLCLVKAEFRPEVSLSDCTNQTVVIKLRNAAEGGIMYIQGKGAACRQTTVAATRHYQFNFDLCQLEYNMSFRLIIQKSPDVQTGHDKVIPVLCLVDMGPIMVGNTVFPGANKDLPGFNKTIKPQARMKIKTNTTEEARTAYLTDSLTMQVQLDEDFRDDFDIKAKECTAASIKVVEDDCSTNRQLFPDFVRDNSGALQSNFDAFIPTDMTGTDRVYMTYSCTLVLCRGKCSKTVCEQLLGRGRKRRDTDNGDEDRITVGTSISILTSTSSRNIGLDRYEKEEFCLEKTLVFIILVAACTVLFISWGFGAYLYSRMRADASNSAINVARRVGRRLSSILNIPTNYELNDQKGLQFIPEYEGTPPERRKSVTMSHMEYMRD